VKLLLVLFLFGCAMPTKEREFCYPKIKYDRDKREVFVGIKCHNK
jgi:hypothetical protein